MKRAMLFQSVQLQASFSFIIFIYLFLQYLWKPVYVSVKKITFILFLLTIQFNSIQVDLYSANLIVAKQLYRKLSFYNIFSSSLSVVTVKLMCIYGINIQ